MKTLIIYDNTGRIFLQMSGSYVTPQGGINYIEVDSTTIGIKVVKSVNVDTKQLVLEDLPKTELQLTQEKVANLENYILEKETSNTANSL